MKRKTLLILLIVILIAIPVILVILLFPIQPDGNGIAVCTATNRQFYPMICEDGEGGAIIAWQDNRSGADYDIYAQRIDSAGQTLWQDNGVLVYVGVGDQTLKSIISDGADGAILTWNDNRSGDIDIYVQRINSTGHKLWAINGIPVVTGQGDHGYVVATTDQANGIIVAWDDLRGGDPDVYAQRINATGHIIWNFNGTDICLELGIQQNSRISTDGEGGAIIAWVDKRNGTNDIYAQRINSIGAINWTINGIPICTEADSQMNHGVCSDGSKGAIITWQDQRTGINFNIYAQRVNSTGNILWDANGTVVSAADDDQIFPIVCSDGAEGAIIVWRDYRDGPSYDLYAQRLNSIGAPQWTANGTVVCNAAFTQSEHSIDSDGAGGAMVTWHDYRDSTTAPDVYAQHINSLGEMQWSNGTPLSTAENEQHYPELVHVGSGIFIFTWMDKRGSDYDIYAGYIPPLGSTVIPGFPMIYSLSILGGLIGIIYLSRRQKKIWSQ